MQQQQHNRKLLSSSRRHMLRLHSNWEAPSLLRQSSSRQALLVLLVLLQVSRSWPATTELLLTRQTCQLPDSSKAQSLRSCSGCEAAVCFGVACIWIVDSRQGSAAGFGWAVLGCGHVLNASCGCRVSSGCEWKHTSTPQLRGCC
jgi:hypothetical protein